MTTSNNDLMGQLKEKLIAASQDEIQQVIKEAQLEAIQEAKALLKERMLDGILKHALSQAEPINGKGPKSKNDKETEEKEVVAK